MTDDSDPIELAMRVVQKMSTEPMASPQTIVSEPTDSFPRGPASDKFQQPPPELRSVDLVRAGPRERKSPGELAAMILDDLRKMEGCPQHDVHVTVYGSNPWNAWLRFGSQAGPVPDKAALLDFCVIITERMKRLYDVSF
jgi:hypothetical protein